MNDPRGPAHKAPLLYDLSTPIPAGELAAAYLQGIEDAVRDLRSDRHRAQIARAAQIAADRVRAGHDVWASSFTHVLDGEVLVNNRSPVRAFRGISWGGRDGSNFTSNLKAGDLFFWFGEWTLNLPWRDYLAVIRSTGADFIVSYRPFSEPVEPYAQGHDVFYDQQLDDALMVLEQHWPMDNAVVPIPFPPGKMAPVSGVYVCLQWRMLDAAIADRLQVPPVPSPAESTRR